MANKKRNKKNKKSKTSKSLPSQPIHEKIIKTKEKIPKITENDLPKPVEMTLNTLFLG